MKEDVPVDVSTSMTLTQLTLIWMMLGGLIAWTLFFAVLALRPERKKTDQNVLVSHTAYAKASTPTVVPVVAKVPVARQESNGQAQIGNKESHSVPVHS